MKIDRKILFKKPKKNSFLLKSSLVQTDFEIQNRFILHQSVEQFWLIWECIYLKGFKLKSARKRKSHSNQCLKIVQNQISVDFSNKYFRRAKKCFFLSKVFTISLLYILVVTKGIWMPERCINLLINWVPLGDYYIGDYLDTCALTSFGRPIRNLHSSSWPITVHYFDMSTWAHMCFETKGGT